MSIFESNNRCDKCFKNELMTEGILCKLLLIKPWEEASKSQKSIHYYLLADTFHIEFDDGRCCYYYIFIPTTSNQKIKNDYWLKINSENWFENNSVQLKLDEIFILQDFDLKIWSIFGANKDDFNPYPQLIMKETSNKWKLNDKKIFKEISSKFWENIFENKTMFFILNRKTFQNNSKYISKKLESKYVYCTHAFLPEFNEYIDHFFIELINITNDIRVNNKFNNKKELIEIYKKNHFNNIEDKRIEKK